MALHRRGEPIALKSLDSSHPRPAPRGERYFRVAKAVRGLRLSNVFSCEPGRPRPGCVARPSVRLGVVMHASSHAGKGVSCTSRTTRSVPRRVARLWLCTGVVNPPAFHAHVFPPSPRAARGEGLSRSERGEGSSPFQCLLLRARPSPAQPCGTAKRPLGRGEARVISRRERGELHLPYHSGCASPCGTPVALHRRGESTSISRACLPARAYSTAVDPASAQRHFSDLIVLLGTYMLLSRSF